MMSGRPGLGIDTLIGIPEAAKLTGVNERTMRRRLTKLDRKLRADGNSPVLVRLGERVWKVRAEALRAALHTREMAAEASEAQADRVDAIESRVAHVDRKLEALRNRHLAEERRQQERWEIQARVNARIVENQKDLHALERM